MYIEEKAPRQEGLTSDLTFGFGIFFPTDSGRYGGAVFLFPAMVVLLFHNEVIWAVMASS